MSINKTRFVLRVMTLSIVTGVFLMGCSSNDSESDGEQAETQTTGPETSTFDGSWVTDCFEQRVFGTPEDSQPDGYVKQRLTLDSSTNSYSTVTRMYTDSQCNVEDPNASARTVSGEYSLDDAITTSSGLEATVVRYVSNGTSPDLTGLLYRDGDVLYREQRQSTLIEDEVPTELSLSVPWRLEN